jgi:uncharacterized protein YegJ (DUF2314 family)
MYKPLQLKIFFLVCLLLVSSCELPSSRSGTPITDEEFDKAVGQAHDTLEILRGALLAPKSSYDFVGVKVRFTGHEAFEDIWTEPLDYYDGYFSIRMIDGVTVKRGLNTERIVTVSLSDVLDWVIIEDDGNLIGGYTIRLSYEHMTRSEKEEFLRVTGYKIR